jgi:hypothetical protein
MTDHSAREVWLRGPLPGYPPQAMPVAQSLLQTAEELERAVRRPHPLTADELWARPGGAASAGYHLAHLAGAPTGCSPTRPAARSPPSSSRR